MFIQCSLTIAILGIPLEFYINLFNVYKVITYDFALDGYGGDKSTAIINRTKDIPINHVSLITRSWPYHTANNILLLYFLLHLCLLQHCPIDTHSGLCSVTVRPHQQQLVVILYSLRYGQFRNI